MIPLVSSLLSLLTLTNVFLPECQGLALENGGKTDGTRAWAGALGLPSHFPGLVSRGSKGSRGEMRSARL